MQSTSSLYKSILAGEHWFETRLSINGNAYDQSKILSLTRQRQAFPGNSPSIGSAIAAVMELTIIKPSFSIPARAQIDVEIRALNGSQTSEWIKQGTYFIDTRKERLTRSGEKTLEISAFDAMIKAEADYPDTDHDWPYRDTLVVAEIAQAIGVAVDSRTRKFLTSTYMVQLPTDYTMRETLEQIAGAYGGNFVITNDNKLLFVPLYGLDYSEVGNFLADENGNALTFGNEGWFIFV
jgi:hypothetical protein